MVAGVLKASGLHFGGPLKMTRRPYQPRGFFEHRGVRDKIVKPKLRRLGADPVGQHPLPPRDLNPTELEVRTFAKKVRNKLNGAEAYKDAKALLLWPYFRRGFPDALWILVRRDRKAIAKSCLRTPFMKNRQYLAGWLDWVDEHLKRMEDLKESGAAVFEFWPDPTEAESFRPMVEAVGLEFDVRNVKRALVPQAWHS
jgi:hypothetical protein